MLALAPAPGARGARHVPLRGGGGSGTSGGVFKYALVGISEPDRSEIDAILQHSRGWASQYRVVNAADPGAEDIRAPTVYIMMKSSAWISAEYGAKAGKLSGYTSAGTSTWPHPSIFINEENWDAPPAAFMGDQSRDDPAVRRAVRRIYRQYLILHEFGHYIGYKHVEPGPSGTPCHVMYQQSKGTNTGDLCYAHPFAPGAPVARRVLHGGSSVCSRMGCTSLEN